MRKSFENDENENGNAICDDIKNGDEAKNEEGGDNVDAEAAEPVTTSDNTELATTPDEANTKKISTAKANTEKASSPKSVVVRVDTEKSEKTSEKTTQVRTP